MDPLPLDDQHVERRASAGADAKREAAPIRPAAAMDARDFIKAVNCEALASDIHSINNISSTSITQTGGDQRLPLPHEAISSRRAGMSFQPSNDSRANGLALFGPLIVETKGSHHHQHEQNQGAKDVSITTRLEHGIAKAGQHLFHPKHFSLIKRATSSGRSCKA